MEITTMSWTGDQYWIESWISWLKIEDALEKEETEKLV